MSAEIEQEPIPFETYPLTLDGRGTYTVLEPAEATAHRLQEPSGQVITMPCADSTATLTAAELGAFLDDPPAPDPAPTVFTPLQILSRMTPAEEAALAGSTDLSVAVVRQRLITASEVRSDDPRTAEGAAVLVAKGILTAERVAEIFPT